MAARDSRSASSPRPSFPDPANRRHGVIGLDCLARPPTAAPTAILAAIACHSIIPPPFALVSKHQLSEFHHPGSPDDLRADCALTNPTSAFGFAFAFACNPLTTRSQVVGLSQHYPWFSHILVSNAVDDQLEKRHHGHLWATVKPLALDKMLQLQRRD